MRDWMDDAPEYRELSSKTHIARKEHKCDACRQLIQPGDKYVATAQLLDFKFELFKCHYLCPIEAKEMEEQRQAELREFNDGLGETI